MDDIHNRIQYSVKDQLKNLKLQIQRKISEIEDHQLKIKVNSNSWFTFIFKSIKFYFVMWIKIIFACSCHLLKIRIPKGLSLKIHLELASMPDLDKVFRILEFDLLVICIHLFESDPKWLIFHMYGLITLLLDLP